VHTLRGARGELSAEPGEINRLEGAAAALDAFVRERANEVV
jgi:hypothetical protein